MTAEILSTAEGVFTTTIAQSLISKHVWPTLKSLIYFVSFSPVRQCFHADIASVFTKAEGNDVAWLRVMKYICSSVFHVFEGSNDEYELYLKIEPLYNSFQ